MPQKSKLKLLLNAINLPRKICFHIFGKNHCSTHRIAVGVFIGFFGVILAHEGPGLIVLPCAALRGLFTLICDFSGYALHGLGLVPLIDSFAELGEESIKDTMNEL
jgi:hypothetical protein